MSNDRISDRDVERIAGAVSKRILLYGLIAVLAALVLPVMCLYAYRAGGP